MPRKLRDTQRARVYTWESLAVPTIELPYLDLRTDIHEIVERIGQLYGIPRTINVRDGRGCPSALFQPGPYAISLPRWARTMPVVLHEAAHWVTWWLHRGDRSKFAPHGREFVAVYMYLLNRFHGVKLSHLSMTANAAGVDFASVEAHKPFGGLRKC